MAAEAGATVAEINPEPTGRVSALGGVEIAATAVTACVPLVSRLKDPTSVD